MYITEYRKALAMGQKEARWHKSHGFSPYLPVLDEILAEEETCGEVDLGLVEIPLDLIVGTEFSGRSLSFSHSFKPLLDEDSEFASKWMALCQAHMNEGILEPIKVHEYMHTFYVREGHKRVSVLRYFGVDRIPAYATRIMPVRSEARASKIYYEFVEFYRLSGINYIWLSGVGRYARLQAAACKQPEEVWSEQARKDFYYFYLNFSSAYKAKSARELDGYITMGDALLLFLEYFNYDEVKGFTPTEIRSHFVQLRELFPTQFSLEEYAKKLLQWLSSPVRSVAEAAEAMLHRTDGE